MCNDGSVGSKRFGWIKILHILKNRDHISGLINIRKLQCNDFILQGFSIFQDQFLHLLSTKNQTTMGKLDGICRFSGIF